LILTSYRLHNSDEFVIDYRFTIRIIGVSEPGKPNEAIYSYRFEGEH
jgi:hypothetical protein